MVNFFEHQQQAKRNTKLLVLLFALAFIAIMALVAGLAAIIMGAVQRQGQQTVVIEPQLLVFICAIIAVAIGIVMLFKWSQLRHGGSVVAESLGGVALAPDSSDPLERRILNVVEEMAIAANMPVPTVYLLPNESAINAFAAGLTTQDAVIGLTRGAVETFNREQLQAVVAHEFSHILNGDMRLNLRLIAALAGILAFAHLGRVLLQSARFRSRGKNNNALPLLGLALLIIGAIGVFFGNLIKAAVSRQREYLADSAAVQFTRNPRALSAALQQIGARQHGSRMQHPNVDQVEHLFFSQALSKWFTLMATHPPLEKRIKRLEPSWNGRYPLPQEAHSKATEAEVKAAARETTPLDRLAALALPMLLVEQARSREQAPQLVQQLVLNQLSSEPTELAQALRQLSETQQFALVEIALPALRIAPDSKRLALLQDLEQLAASQDLFHWGLYQLIARQLLPPKRFSQTLKREQALAISCQALERAERQQALDRSQLELALNTHQHEPPAARQQIVQAWLETVHADDHVSETERKLIAILCACIEAPLPDEFLAI